MSANTYLVGTLIDPQFLYISAITRAYPMVVTVTAANTYVVGQLVHFSVPSTYGMFQLNQQTGKILSISNLDFSVDIDSRPFDAFVTPPAFVAQPATLAPAGCRNIYNSLAEPFHSQNNQGN